MPMRRRIYLLFLLSGSAGLIYQVVWSRFLNEIFGVTAYAVTTVLATFLAGLALGSVLLGRISDRRENPLRFYGWLEIGIGMAGLAGAWIVDVLEPLHIAAANRFEPQSLALIVVRTLLASLVVLPPTFLMGGTLPVITRALVGRIPRLGRELSVLYALNTLGAVIGCMAAGFVIIRWLGLHPTLWVAVAINLAVGIGALLLSGLGDFGARQRGPGVEPGERGRAGSEAAAGSKTTVSAPGIALLLVMASSGFVSLGLEVLWTRVLVLIVGTSTYAFVTMLSCFLVGITLGSLVARAFVDRIRNVKPVFGWIQLGIAASALLTVPVLNRVNTGEAQSWLEGFTGGWLSLILARFGISFLLMLVSTTLIGMTFPLAGKMYARHEDSVGGEVGAVYGANTLGNILGAFIGGFVLLPAFGLQKGIAVLTLLNLVNAGWALLPSAAERRRAVAILRIVPIALGLGAAATMLMLWKPRPFSKGNGVQGDQVLYYKEGIVNTVEVIQRFHDAAQRLMNVDGMKIGESSGGVDEKQQALAHFPFLLIPDGPPRNVLSIGLGTGILIGEVARHSGVESIDCLEISPSVIEGSRYFDEFNHRVADNPAVRIINDDGVNFLRRVRGRYEAIISDAKSRTAHAGNSLFFSRDYYQLCLDHLDSSGVMIQWVPLSVASSEFKIILRTFLDVFPHAYLWYGPPDSCFLVGTIDPLVLDLTHIGRVLREPATENLRRYGWRNSHDFASLLVTDAEGIRPWIGGEVTVNSLETPVLEFYSPRTYAIPVANRRAENLSVISKLWGRALTDVTVTGADGERLERGRRAVGELIRGFALLLSKEPNRVPGALELLDAAIELSPDHTVLQRAVAGVHFDLGLSLQRSGRVKAAIVQYRRAVSLNPNQAEARHNLGNALGSVGEMDQATLQLREAVRINPRFAGAHNSLGHTLLAQGQLEEAISHYAQAVELSPRSARFHNDLGVVYVVSGRIEASTHHFEQASRLSPRWAAPLAAMAWTLATHPNPNVVAGEQAVELARRAKDLAREKHPVILDTLAAAYARAGRYEDAIRAAEEARTAALTAGDRRLAEAIDERLALYRARQPFFERHAPAMLRRLTTPFSSG